MFFVINKEKVYSYLVTLSVIGVLFTISAVFPKDSIETSTRNVHLESNVIDNSIKNWNMEILLIELFSYGGFLWLLLAL